jgi:SAM-dependent methyltransferase
LPFPDGSFDLATSRFGVMFFRDIGLALRELRRVLQDQARACFLAWGPIEQPYWQTMMGVVHGHVGGPLLQPGGPDPFRFAAPGSLSAELAAAGFRDLHEETKTLPWTWPGTPQEVWEQARAVSVPFRPVLDRVPENLWPQINSEVLAAIGRYVKGENIEFGASVVLASGRK